MPGIRFVEECTPSRLFFRAHLQRAVGYTTACRLLAHRTCGARASILGKGGGGYWQSHINPGEGAWRRNWPMHFKTVIVKKKKRMRHSAFPGGRPPQYWQSLAGLNC